MKKSYLLSLFLLFSVVDFIYAQEHDHSKCGTPSGKSHWLVQYQKNPSSYDKRSGELLYVPLSVKVVNRDSGEGFINERLIIENICDLNVDFADSELYFYLGEPIQYVNNTEYTMHDNFFVGTEMMFEHNTENMINIYITETGPSNTAGYNLPYAGCVVTNSSVGADSDTWAHEIGHNLSLPHPFLGWEGGQTHDGSSPANYNAPAPEKVTYDYTNFKDQPFWDTLIIDTAYVELVDGSNCDIAADGFCDTPADYLALGGWPCNGDGISNQEQTDPTGAKFRSDASLIMSYSSDACSSRFTEEQGAAMRANLLDEKSDYLGNSSPIDPPSEEMANLNVPAEGQDLYFQDAYLEWDEIEGAEAYVVHLSLSSTFGFNAMDTIVNNNYIEINELKFKNKTHYLRIKPFNAYNTCNDYQVFGEIYVTDVETNTKDLDFDVRISPSVISEQQPLTISGEGLVGYSYELVNMGGIVLDSGVFRHTRKEFDTSLLQSGMYLLRIRNEEKVGSFKVIVAK